MAIIVYDELSVAHGKLEKRGKENMENGIIIGIIAVVAIFGIRSAVKHLKGEGGCCGGGSCQPQKKKLKNVCYRKNFKVKGMHCEHCKNAVEGAVNNIRGVAGKVNLRKGILTVSYEEKVDDELIKSCIEKAGYEVAEA